MNLVANITHDSIDLVLIKFNTSFVLKAPQLDVCLGGFFCRSNIITSFYRGCNAAFVC